MNQQVNVRYYQVVKSKYPKIDSPENIGFRLPALHIAQVKNIITTITIIQKISILQEANNNRYVYFVNTLNILKIDFYSFFRFGFFFAYEQISYTHVHTIKSNYKRQSEFFVSLDFSLFALNAFVGHQTHIKHLIFFMLLRSFTKFNLIYFNLIASPLHPVNRLLNLDAFAVYFVHIQNAFDISIEYFRCMCVQISFCVTADIKNRRISANSKRFFFFFIILLLFFLVNR